MAAYRSGEYLEDERTGEKKFYRRGHKPESVILAPEHSPEWIKDRNRLWNEVEKMEKRKDAQLCREINVALPKEFTAEQQRAVLYEFCQREFVERGMVADVAIHRDDENNPHAHIMLTMREVGQNGFGQKVREWNDRALIEQWREAWANDVNRIFEQLQRPERIDHRSFERQGITDRMPTIHEGPTVREMERRGIRTDRGDLNRAAQQHNALVIELEAYRQEKTMHEKKQAEKAESAPMVAEQNKNPRERGGASMSAIEKRPDMAFQFYSEQKERLDKEFGLYKRRENLVKQWESLTETLKNDRSLKRGEKAEIREKIGDLETQIAKIPEPSELRMSMLRDEYCQIEAKLKEIMDIARDRVAARSAREPQQAKPVKERAVVPVENDRQEALKKQRIVLFNERSKAESEFNLLNDQQERREARVRSIDNQLAELQPKNLWQRLTNNNKELIQKLQRERAALEQEIRERKPELEAAKSKFDRLHKEYQELNAAYRSGSQMEHQEKMRQRQVTRDGQEYER
jgi:hypothetical protein